MKTLKSVKAIFAEGGALALTDNVGVVHRLPMPTGFVSLDNYHPLLRDYDVSLIDAFWVSDRTQALVAPDRSIGSFSTGADQDFIPSSEYAQQRDIIQMAAQLVQQQERQRLRRERNQAVKKPKAPPQESRAQKEQEPAPVPIEDKRPKDEADDDKGGQ